MTKNNPPRPAPLTTAYPRPSTAQLIADARPKPQRQKLPSPVVGHVVVTVATLKDGKNTLRLHVYGPYTQAEARREARRIDAEHDPNAAVLNVFVRPLLNIPVGD